MSTSATSSTTTITFVRHGESEWNSRNICQGYERDSENPLNSVGRTQAYQRGLSFADRAFDFVYASDLQRARETAELALGDRYKVETTPLLREYSVGTFEGKTRAEFLSAFAPWPQLSFEERMAFKPCPLAESLVDSLVRIEKFIKTMREMHPGTTVAAFSHSGVMRGLAIKLGAGTFETIGGFENTGYMTVQVKEAEVNVTELIGIFPWRDAAKALKI